MAVWTEELATDISYPNIDVFRRYRDGVHSGYRITPKEGYVMYDTNDENYDIDPETGNEIPVIHYFTIAYLPTNFNFDRFSWVAVPRSEVDENYIFGTENNEVM